MGTSLCWTMSRLRLQPDDPSAPVDNTPPWAQVGGSWQPQERSGSAHPSPRALPGPLPRCVPDTHSPGGPAGTCAVARTRNAKTCICQARSLAKSSAAGNPTAHRSAHLQWELYSTVTHGKKKKRKRKKGPRKGEL